MTPSPAVEANQYQLTARLSFSLGVSMAIQTRKP